MESISDPNGPSERSGTKSRGKNPLFVAVIGAVIAALLYPMIIMLYNFWTCPKISETVDTGTLESIWEKEYNKNLADKKSLVIDKKSELIKEYNITPYEGEAEVARLNQIKNEILADFFKAGNLEIFDYVEKVTEMSKANKEFRGVTYIYGSAGIGKSFVRDHLIKDRSIHSVLEMEEVLQIGEAYGSEVVEKTQFKLDNQEFKLPYVQKPGNFDFESMIGLSGKGNINTTIIIDDLDEFHPDTSEMILRRIDDFFDDNSHRINYLHFVVFGRPEGFASWIFSTHNEGTPPNFKSFTLRGPKYETQEDILVVAMNHYLYNENMKHKKEHLGNLLKIMKDHPFTIATTTNNLSHGNYVVQASEKFKEETAKAFEIKKWIFRSILARNSTSHNRPSRAQASGEVYERALQNVAWSYLEKIDGNGFFEVSPGEVIPVIRSSMQSSHDVFSMKDSCEIEVFQCNVQSLLEYSGLVEVEVSDKPLRKYRFQPLWVHEYLIDTRLRRSEHKK